MCVAKYLSVCIAVEVLATSQANVYTNYQINVVYTIKMKLKHKAYHFLK